MTTIAVVPSDLRDQLAAHFAPTDIEWRIGQAGKKDDGSIWAKAFAYITNRAIQDRLDAVVGPANWRNEEPRIVQIADADGKVVTAFLCGLSVKVDGEWITKWDGAEPSDMEPVKGGLSGSMKRAAVQWGIGRYLYDLPEGWAKVNEHGAHYANLKVKVRGQEERVSFKWDPPDLPTWALPEGNGNGNGKHHDESTDGGDATDRLRRQAAAEQSRNVQTAAQARAETTSPAERTGPYAPTEKQVAFYQRLAESPVFSYDERQRALIWLATKATKQSIKDQIDWLKRQVETRRANREPGDD